MSPDFHYFLGLHVGPKTSHSIAGAFYFCLPLALAALWLFHRVLKMPLISLAPARDRARLAQFAVPFRFGPGRRFAMVLVSLLLGIFTHLLWDSFTHGEGWMVGQFPALRTMVLQEFWGGRPVYSLLQHGSTVLGMAALAIAYRRWSQATSPQPVAPTLKLSPGTRQRAIAAIASSACVISGTYAYDRYGDAGRVTILAAHAVISFVSMTLLGLLVFSLWWHREFRQLAPNP